jgi:hypothetical protein
VLINWKAANEEWIGAVRAELLPRLAGDSRFSDAGAMAQRLSNIRKGSSVRLNPTAKRPSV